MRKVNLKEFINEAFKASEENPILIDKFINNAMEVDVDAISDGQGCLCCGNNATHRRSWNSFWRLCMLSATYINQRAIS